MIAPLRPMLFTLRSSAFLPSLGIALAVGACSSDDLQGVQAEVSDSKIKIDLPAVPDFVIPAANPDGSHSVTEMRLNGKSYLDSEIRMQGTVLWIYDCPAAVRTPEMTEKDLKKLLAEHPERCIPPHFVIGEDASSSVKRGLQVVEYPRALRKDELRALPKDEIRAKKAALAAMPAFKVGDEVVVTGQWSLVSPRNFQDTDGLMTYKSMVNLSSAPE